MTQYHNPSVHLENFPDFRTIPNCINLVTSMRLVRGICNSGLSIRHANNVNLRMPVLSVIIYSANTKIEEMLSSGNYINIIKEELNVKEISFSMEVSSMLRKKVALNLKMCGAKLGAKLNKTMKAINSGDFVYNDIGGIEVNGITLNEGEFIVSFEARDESSKDRLAMVKGQVEEQEIFILMDTSSSEELKKEGLIREVGRFIQQARKKQGFIVNDMASVLLHSSDEAVMNLLESTEVIEHLQQKTRSKITIGAIATSVDEYEIGERGILRIALHKENNCS